MNIKQAEKRALNIGIFANLTMAFAGWFAFYLTGMQALLLDGNFSFISAVSCLTAITNVVPKLINYFTVGPETKIETGIVFYYALVMVIVCFTLSYIYSRYNKKGGKYKYYFNS